MTFDSLVFAGGGSKGALWSQILSDVTGLPVRVPVVREATALGCEMCIRDSANSGAMRLNFTQFVFCFAFIPIFTASAELA